MSENPAHERDPASTPEIHLAECWAGVTKALALYPDSNERVQAKLGELLAAVHAVQEAVRGAAGADLERGVAILFQEDHVFVGSIEHTFEPGSTLAWLRTRLDHSALAGIEIMPDVTRESFTAFTRALLGNYLRKDGERTFEALWTELYTGVVLIDRRFEGTFGGFASMGKFAGGHGGVSSRDTRHFITGLLMHPKVRRRIARMGELGSEDDETSEASGLLRDVLDDVPADALKSRDVLIDWVCERLDDLADRVAGSGTSATTGEGERFAALLRQVSRQHFARQGPDLDRIKAGTIVETKPGGGRARDAEITDDVESLAAEVQQLPADLAMHLGDADDAATPEQIAVILHYAVHLQRPEELPGQRRLLEQLLAAPGPAELAVIRKYVSWEGDDKDGAAARATSAVIRVLEEAGRTSLLRACGALHTDLVVQTFPAHFGHFLGALDVQLAADLAELDDVLARVGPQQLLNAAGKVLPAVERLAAEDVQRLLDEAKASRLPLVRLLLQAHSEAVVTPVAEYLGRLNLREAEAFLLHTIRPYALLTPEYLMGLIDVHLGRASSFALRGPVSDVLCRHIIALGDADPLDRSRMESIRLLARYPSSRGEEMLRMLRKFGLGMFRRGEPPAVRRLARSLLKNWQAA